MENRELLGQVAHSADYMLRLIDDVLDFTKISAGRLELELKPTDVAELIRENLSFNAILAKKKGSKLQFEAGASPPPLLNLDAKRMHQVLNNLVSNALKFSVAGSIIMISLRCAADEVIIAVADHGQGIAADELGNLFKAYSRTRTRSTGNEESTGLGLAIVRRIVEAHGGQIRVESELGEARLFRGAANEPARGVIDQFATNS